jgi:hypothetical protein
VALMLVPQCRTVMTMSLPIMLFGGWPRPRLLCGCRSDGMRAAVDGRAAGAPARFSAGT